MGVRSIVNIDLSAEKELHPTSRILVEGAADLEALPALKEELAVSLARSSEVVVAVDCREVNLPLVQLICAAHRSAAGCGRQLRMEWLHPEAACNLRQRTGFTRHTACPRSVAGDCLWLEEHWT